MNTPAAVFTFTVSPRRGEKDIVTTWVRVFSLSLSMTYLVWVFQMLRNRLPTSLELDTDTFQEVMNAQHKPLVVIVAAAASELESVAQNVQEIATHWKDSKAEGNVVFTWMDAERWASWLKNMYGVKQDALPRVIIADHSVRINGSHPQSLLVDQCSSAIGILRCRSGW